jgi:hypothetical protein
MTLVLLYFLDKINYVSNRSTKQNRHTIKKNFIFALTMQQRQTLKMYVYNVISKYMNFKKFYI